MKKKTASAQGAAPIPAKLLRGRTFAMAGKFGHPDASELADFLTSQGAVLTSDLSEADGLLVGEGRTPALQRKAEQLNASGAALIEIVDDPTSLIDFSTEQVRAALSHPASIKRLGALLHSRSWLGIYFDISGSDFSGKQVGAPGAGAMLYMEHFDVSKCRFDKASITQLYFYDDTDFSSNSFRGATLTDVWMLHALKLKLEDVKASRFRLIRLDRGQLIRCEFDGWTVKELTRSKLQSVRVRKLETEAVDRPFFKRVEFHKCRIDGAKLLNANLIGCSFRDCEFVGGAFQQARFVNCKFENVTFRDMKWTDVELKRCDLRNVRFEGVAIAGWGLGGSKLERVRLIKCRQAAVRLTDKQAKSLAGLDESARTPAITSAAAKQIADAMLEADEFRSTILATVGSTPLKMRISKTYYSQEFVWEVGARPSKSLETALVQGNWGYTLTRSHVLTGFDFLSRKAGAGVPNLKSITIKSAASPLSTREAKQLLRELWCEIFGFAG